MEKSKVLISGFVITTLIVVATINLIFSNKTMQKAEMKNEISQEKIIADVDTKKIYGTFKTDASWVKDPTEINNVIDMANDYSIVKAKIISIGEANFLEPTAPTPYTSIVVDITETIEGILNTGTKTIYVEGGDVKVENIIKILNDVEIQKMGLDTLSDADKKSMYITYTSDYSYNLKKDEEYIMILSNNKVTTIMASGYGIFKEENNNNSTQAVKSGRSFVNVITGKEFKYTKEGENY